MGSFCSSHTVLEFHQHIIEIVHPYQSRYTRIFKIEDDVKVNAMTTAKAIVCVQLCDFTLAIP